MLKNPQAINEYKVFVKISGIDYQFPKEMIKQNGTGYKNKSKK